MKKILSAIVLFALVVLPMSVMAMTTISDNELSSVTGQAGVSINVDVTANLTIGTIAWGDSDGFTGYTNAGFVGIEGLNLTVHMSGRHDGPFANTATNEVGYLRNDPIMIDVGTSTAGVSQVRIGLPTSEIRVSTLQTDIFVSGSTADTTTQQLGSIYMSGVVVLLGQGNPADFTTYDAGYVTLQAAAPGAGNVGIGIGFNVLIDSITIGTISYGNTTSILASSFGDAATQGYVGITNFNLDDVTISGGIKIGVGTLNGTDLGVASFGSPTMVNIIIDAGTRIYIPGAITGVVELGPTQTLSAGQVLGNFFIGGVDITFANNAPAAGYSATGGPSKVQIWAH